MEEWPIALVLPPIAIPWSPITVAPCPGNTPPPMAIPCAYRLPTSFTVALVPIAIAVPPFAIESLPTATLGALLYRPFE